MEKEIPVSGSIQKKSLRALKKTEKNHISIENTAFNIYTKKFITVFTAIESSEIIDRKKSPPQL